MHELMIIRTMKNPQTSQFELINSDAIIRVIPTDDNECEITLLGDVSVKDVPLSLADFRKYYNIWRRGLLITAFPHPPFTASDLQDLTDDYDRKSRVEESIETHFW